MSAPVLPRVHNGLCLWCDYPAGTDCISCNVCRSHARWSIAMPEGDDDSFVTAAFACSQHLATVLHRYEWSLDVCEVRDLGQLVEGS